MNNRKRKESITPFKYFGDWQSDFSKQNFRVVLAILFMFNIFIISNPKR